MQLSSAPSFFPPVTRPGIAARIAGDTAFLGIGMALNAIDAQERSLPVTPARLVAGVFDQYRPRMVQALEGARRIAPELEPQLAAAQQAMDAILLLARAHARDTSTVLVDDAAIQRVLDRYEALAMPLFAAAAAIDPSGSVARCPNR